MLIIRKEQIAALRVAARDGTRRRITRHLLREHPEAADRFDIDDLERLVDDAITVAYAHRFESERDVAWLAAMCLELSPRFHQQWMPDEVRVEQWFSPDTVKSVRAMGYKVEYGVYDGSDWEPYWSDGECAGIDLKTGERLGASDIRNDGKALGF